MRSSAKKNAKNFRDFVSDLKGAFVISTLYRGSVKDLLGPVQVPSGPAIIFEYSDAFSVFDWGRMPDLLPHKGEALAILAAHLFERLEDPQVWRDFSKSPEALALRKANRFGAVFNELGEELQADGLRTHYLGVLDSPSGPPRTEPGLETKNASQATQPFRRMLVREVSVVKPVFTSVLGRTLPDYDSTRNSTLPRLVPLEVVFRMECPAGSSLLDRVARDPGYLASLGFPDLRIEPGQKWSFPVLEFFTKLETTDRPVPLSEALAISGLTATQLQEVLLKTAWVSGILKFWFARIGLELADGKLEWAIAEDGRCFLVDAIGPDELRILKDGLQLSKEFLRSFYRPTSWYRNVEKAKLQAQTQGSTEWKRLVPEGPPALPHAYRELATHVYLALTNELTGKKWFAEAWSLDLVLQKLRILQEGRAL
jgi:phosphoribosylaminoimidazole-succinocarboxamide synthase